MIVEVGGGIREYTRRRAPVLEPLSAGAMCDGAHGAPLIPWPNRLADGRYSFDGSEHQLPLDEPERNNAIHGLLRWRPWSALEHERERCDRARGCCRCRATRSRSRCRSPTSSARTA